MIVQEQGTIDTDTVADFFRWTQQGEYKFDPKYWPDVEGMCKELDEMGIRLMASVCPTLPSARKIMRR